MTELIDWNLKSSLHFFFTQTPRCNLYLCYMILPTKWPPVAIKSRQFVVLFYSINCDRFRILVSKIEDLWNVNKFPSILCCYIVKGRNLCVSWTSCVHSVEFTLVSKMAVNWCREQMLTTSSWGAADILCLPCDVSSTLKWRNIAILIF